MARGERTYGEKLIRLYQLMLTARKWYSTRELEIALDCSKQTVARLVRDLSMAGIPIAEDENSQSPRRIKPKAYRIDSRPQKWPAVSPMEIAVLEMARAFSSHLMSRTQANTVTTTLMKAGGGNWQTAFGCYSPGRINYARHQQTLQRLIEAIAERQVCRVRYRKIEGAQARELWVRPHMLVANQDTVYLHAALARNHRNGQAGQALLLAVHRLERVKATPETFEPPDTRQIESDFNATFGIIKQEPFWVRLRLWGWAAAFARERHWSAGERYLEKSDGVLELIFQAASTYELLGQVLWFGDQAKIMAPDWLVAQMQTQVAGIAANYAARPVSNSA